MEIKKNGCIFRIIVIAVCIVSIAMMDSQWNQIRNARKSNSLSDYERYLNNYPEGRYSNEAYESLLQLWDAMEVEDFQEKQSISLYSSYLDKYKDWRSRYSDTAFQTMLYNKMRLKCLIHYENALRINTIDGWNKYLVYVPEDFHFDAQFKYDSLFNAIWGTEESAWKYVCEVNTVEDYEYYEKLFPQGKHHKEAENKAVSLRVDFIFGGKHGINPPLEKISNRNSRLSIVRITNSTSYTLTVYYSGAEGKRAILSSFETQDVELKNGIYRIAASVDASDVLPYAGTEDLTGGNYEVEYYISTRYNSLLK